MLLDGHSLGDLVHLWKEDANELVECLPSMRKALSVRFSCNPSTHHHHRQAGQEFKVTLSYAGSLGPTKRFLQE